MSMLSPVSFHGDTIYCINHNDQPYTAMRPIVENMGMAWGAQSEKLNSNKERWSVSIIETVAQDGVMRQSLCMPVRKLPAFLASINPKKVKPELRERIELYQAECDEVLWQYWTEGQATRTPIAEPATPDPDDRLSKRTDPERKALTAVVNLWMSLAPLHAAAARMQVNAHFGRASVDELTVKQVREAIQWVQDKIDALPPAGTRGSMPPPPLLPQPTRTVVTMMAEAKKHEGKTVGQRNAEFVAQKRREIYERLDTLINETHSLLREVHFTPNSHWLIDNRLSHLHRDLYLMAESSMRSALDAMKAGLNMAG